MASINTDWLTVSEACSYLKVTRATLYRWAREGKLRLHKLGPRSTRIRRSELDTMSQAEAPRESDGWARLSEESFARDWENDLDAAYDKWREHYGVRER